MHALRTLLAVVALAACCSAVRAQTATVTTGVDSPTGRLGVAVDLRDLRADGTVVDLRVAVSGAAAVSLDLRTTETFGALGNVTFELGGALRTDGRYQGRAGVRGVFGPAALALELRAFDARPAAFAPHGVVDPGRPDLNEGDASLGLALEAALRLDGATILTLAPEAYLVAGGAALLLESDLTLRRVVGDVDGVVLLHAYSGPRWTEGHAAAGLGAVWRRRRAPSWSGSLWYGFGRDDGPGARLALAERIDGVRFELALAAEPFRSDLAPYRGEASATIPTQAGDLTLRVGGSWSDGPRAAASIGLTLPLDR